MDTFIVALSNNGEVDLRNVTEINAKSKEDAVKIIAADVDPNSIAGAYTVEEYKAICAKRKAQAAANGGAPAGANPFVMDNGGEMSFNEILHSAKAAAASIQPNQRPVQKAAPRMPQKPPKAAPAAAQYFTDNGAQFKLEDGELYKKVWESVEINETTNDKGEPIPPQFQIVSRATGKKIKSDKYGVQQLVWKKVAFGAQ